MRRKRSPSASLEREVIVSVIILYLLITVTMLGIHYLQPSGTTTETSSQSPSHSSFRADEFRDGSDRPAQPH